MYDNGSHGIFRCRTLSEKALVVTLINFTHDGHHPDLALVTP